MGVGQKNKLGEIIKKKGEERGIIEKQIYGGILNITCSVHLFCFFGARKRRKKLSEVFESSRKLLRSFLPAHIRKNRVKAVFSYVGGRGLEPPCLAAPAPKAGVSAISPPAQIWYGKNTSIFGGKGEDFCGRRI